MREKREELEAVIEAALTERHPDVELVDFEVRGQPPILTLFIDRPGGVDLDLLAAVSQSLEELRERYALELRKPKHFAAQLGREVAVTMARPIEGRRNFRGILVAADDQSITLTLEGGSSATLPLDALGKAHVVYNFENDGGQRE